MMERFPALRLILKLGRIGPAVLAILAASLFACLLWGALGWIAAALAPLILVFVYFLAKSYVEIIQIVIEMAH